ncbi:hypothetical protein [Kingella oralis]|uniref:hypothetical protein n=1 Tax=Kingella oralis TaxID=505 RepID=UPI0034E45969
MLSRDGWNTPVRPRKGSLKTHPPALPACQVQNLFQAASSQPSSQKTQPHLNPTPRRLPCAAY